MRDIIESRCLDLMMLIYVLFVKYHVSESLLVKYLTTRSSEILLKIIDTHGKKSITSILFDCR